MIRYDLIRKVEKIRDELNHYNFLFIEMRHVNPIVRLSWKGRHDSLYKECREACKKYETEITKFYILLICNTIKVSDLDDKVDRQLWWEKTAAAFNDIRNVMNKMIVKC